ncbi:MAG: selenide, water dikinase SelD [Gammaproteobacteria bacterium]
MHLPSTPILRDLVLVGGGHAHVEVLRRFAMRPMPGRRLTLITREIHTPYSGMLPGLIAGHYDYDEVHIDLAPLARAAGARLYHDEVVGLDLDGGRVLCRARPPVTYDVLSLDSGITPAMAVPGAAEHAVAVKPVSSFWSRWQALRARIAARGAASRVAVVGGGAGGVEIALAVAHRLRQDAAPGIAHEFHLLTSGADLLPVGHAPAVRRHLRRALERAGVRLHLGAEVTRVESHALVTASGARLEVDEVLWTTHAAAPAWPGASGLAVDASGFVRVDACLQSLSHVHVFAAGDLAAVEGHPRPRAGVFAVRQGPPLTENLRRALEDRPLEPFTPQRRFLGIVSTGGRHAVASRGALALAGDWVWRWKDHIDRRFMRRYQELPVMPMAAASEAPGALDPAMRCGGCGAKVGADLLRAALAALPPAPRADVLVGLDAPDDAAVVRLPAGALAVQSVDSFRAFIDDPWLFGRITANHCQWVIYSNGATPHTALALFTQALAAPRKMKYEQTQLLAGAREVLDAAGAALVGGHTAEGLELSLGFAVNGWLAPDTALTKRGALPGDALILAKPLGAGVLLAAAMRGRARADWLDAALAVMALSNAAAATTLRAHGAHALTDVTGFGLCGHLLEMLTAGGVAARVHLDTLPCLAGAAELAALGIASTLAPDNRRAAETVRIADAASSHAALPLCFDPQTGGGLLGAVPASEAEACVAALRTAGYVDATVIGAVLPAGECALSLEA